MNNSKWIILFIFVFLYIIGIGGAAWHTYGATDPSKAVPIVESLKIIFIMLGGLGVILPTYLNVWQSIETARLLSDQARQNMLENTFRLLEKWDDNALLGARLFLRELKDKRNSLSSDEIIKIILEKQELRQSVVLLFNYFELIRISIDMKRVDPATIKDVLGEIFIDLCDAFKPWIKSLSTESQKDVKELLDMFRT